MKKVVYCIQLSECQNSAQMEAHLNRIINVAIYYEEEVYIFILEIAHSFITNTSGGDHGINRLSFKFESQHHSGRTSNSSTFCPID